jgi:hypothetical protein
MCISWCLLNISLMRTDLTFTVWIGTLISGLTFLTQHTISHKNKLLSLFIDRHALDVHIITSLKSSLINMCEVSATGPCKLILI